MSRWQFSLRGLMLFVLLVAMTLSAFVTGRRLLQAEAELAEYRRTYGILKVADSTRLHAVALWTGEPNHWRWRIHCPPGRYDLCFTTSGIPASGLPKPKRGWNTDFAGMVEVSVAAYKDPKDGVWRYAVSSGGTGSYVDMSISPPDESMSNYGSSILVGDDPTIVSPNEPLVLLQKRAVKRGKQGVTEMNDSEPQDGLMLWVRRTGKCQGDHFVRSW
jgi:hypothetical protein